VRLFDGDGARRRRPSRETDTRQQVNGPGATRLTMVPRRGRAAAVAATPCRFYPAGSIQPVLSSWFYPDGSIQPSIQKRPPVLTLLPRLPSGRDPFAQTPGLARHAGGASRSHRGYWVRAGSGCRRICFAPRLRAA
jgi:hypothetical protein